MQKNLKKIITVFIVGLFTFLTYSNVYAIEPTTCTYTLSDRKFSIIITPDGKGSAEISTDIQTSAYHRVEIKVTAENFINTSTSTIECRNEIYNQVITSGSGRDAYNIERIQLESYEALGKTANPFKLSDSKNNGQSLTSETGPKIVRSCTYNVNNRSTGRTFGEVVINALSDGTLTTSRSDSCSVTIRDNITASMFDKSCPGLYVNGDAYSYGTYSTCSIIVSTEAESHLGGDKESTSHETNGSNNTNSKVINCTYTGMLNGGSIKITNSTGSSYDYVITYPDGKVQETNLLAYSAGKVSKYNLFPSNKCEDIFYSKSKNVIRAVDASNEFVDSNVKEICHSYTDAEQFCANGKCKVSNAICGNSGGSDYGSCPSQLRPAIVFIKRAVFNTLRIFLPILLILLGTIDMARAVMANDDKGLKDATARLIRRFLIAILFFFITTIVSLVITRIAKTTDVEDSDDWKACWIDIN